jgi:LacI family transcriptional regulator
MGIIAAAHRFGLTVGQELALVGYNGIPLSARLATPPSSVRIPLAQIASTAIGLIVNAGKEPHIRKAMPTLIPRESSGSPKHFVAIGRT